MSTQLTIDQFLKKYNKNKSTKPISKSTNSKSLKTRLAVSLFANIFGVAVSLIVCFC